MRAPSSITSKPQDNVQVINLEQCLAKSYKTEDGSVIPGRMVFSHCLIVGQVARALIQRMPAWLRSDLFPQGSELIAAAHDIGKVSPTFQNKIYSALTLRNKSVLSALSSFNPEIEKQWGGHAGVSQATLQDESLGQYIPRIVGQHHGFRPNLTIYDSTSEVFGGKLWNDQRLLLTNQLKSVMGCEFPIVESELKALVLAGLTTVADWIGSGYLFNAADEASIDLVNEAVDLAGFMPLKLKPNLSFNDVFGFDPKDTQIKLIDVANQPGVYVLEAPMGLGKTEAALYAAYQLLEKNEATGIYFALPTQLTSDKIHERVNAFLSKVLADDSSYKQALLVHGNAWLKTSFEMGEEGNPSGAWFAQGKRGILAPFAVGTIDQALMAVLNVKHGFVRTFGLAGKVVILDEVHSYDSFTGTIIETLVDALRKLHCTVIILSATLTQARRAKLLRVTPQATGYPLITALPNVGGFSEIEAGVIPDLAVSIAHESEANAIEEVLRRSEEGQHVLWIENTVNEAQEIYKKLAARSESLGVICGLLHSRFTKVDRAANEDIWVSHFGKSGAATRGQHGRILVGTQVLEQSLDIDADFLVSRIAPTDMLLQRLGRLWRHSETIRPESAQREAWLLAPDLSTSIVVPDTAFGNTAKVYAPYVLCRTLAVWQDISQINLPGQIRELIESTYIDQDENEHMAKHLYQLETTKEKLQKLALLGMSNGGQTQPEEKAQTRYSELESTEVLLIRGYQIEVSDNATWVTLLNGEHLKIPRNGRSLARNTWREISAKLMQNTLKVAEYLAPKAVLKKNIDWLGDYFYLGKPEYEESDLLRVAIVGGDGVINGLDGYAPNDKYKLSYSHYLGYLSNK